MCVMSGVDFMTIAAWVGHRDGGVLIGKVYGHLANEHRKAMAGRAHEFWVCAALTAKKFNLQFEGRMSVWPETD